MNFDRPLAQLDAAAQCHRCQMRDEVVADVDGLMSMCCICDPYFAGYSLS
jgi:hypothetical protein